MPLLAFLLFLGSRRQGEARRCMAQQLLVGRRGKPLQHELADLAAEIENGGHLLRCFKGGRRQLRSCGEPLGQGGDRPAMLIR